MMKLFEPGKIGELPLKNRIVMAPMANRLEEPDGRLSQRAIDYYAARAKGGVGLITTCTFRVIRDENVSAMSLVHDPMVDDKMYLTRLNELAEAVHDYGAKISIQLQSWMGRTTRPGIRDGGALAPSAVPCFWDTNLTTREMTTKEIKRLIGAFESAAEIANSAGIDCIELHSHKGGLLDQFMTSLWNKRTDEYGGNLGNRLRFATEVIQAIKRRVGADFPIVYRYGLTHYLAGGREVDEGIEIARRLEAAGVDALHIDAGCEETIYWIHPPPTLPPGCMVELAEMVKKAVNIPVIAVGKLGYPELAERVLQEGKADFIALGRQLLADPEWPNKVKEGKLEDICPCIGDLEGCEVRIEKRRYVSCTVNPATGMEREFAIKPAEQEKTVLVVGGGPGGMEAARVAALRGHKVTLWERGTALGGNLIPASVPDFKQDYRRLIDYLIAQVKKLGVTIELGKEATPELIQAMKPEVVFIAAGGTPIILEIPGIDKTKVTTAIDLLLGRKEAGRSVIVIGGGIVGSETALYLAQKGKKVTIVEILDSIARDMYQRDNRLHLLKLLAEADVEILTETNVLKITDEGISIANKNGKTSTLEADTVVVAVGLKPDEKFSEALMDKVPEIYTIGDCVKPRKVINAIWEAFRTARLI
jgi:2-enoate reductase